MALILLPRWASAVAPDPLWHHQAYCKREGRQWLKPPPKIITSRE